MTRSLLIPIVLAITTLTLAACGDSDSTPVTAPPDTTGATLPTPPEPSEPSDLGQALDGRTFLASSADDDQLVEGTTVRLTFSEGSMSLNAGCNTLFGGVTFDGDKLTTGMLATTEMACEPELMAQDRWLTDVFSLEPRLALEGDTLTITGAGGALLTMVDRVVADPDRPLVATRWVADGLRSQDAVSTLPAGVVASITFESTDDGDRAVVETGCNRGFADVEITDDVITFGPLGLTKMMCENDAMEVESFMIALLDGDVSYQISAGTLVLDSADTAGSDSEMGGEMGGLGLILVAEADDGTDG